MIRAKMDERLEELRRALNELEKEGWRLSKFVLVDENLEDLRASIRLVWQPLSRDKDVM